MEIIGALTRLLPCLSQFACSFIGPKCDYLKNLKRNKEILQRDVDFLQARGRDIIEKLKQGKVQRGKNPKEEVLVWQKELKNIVNKMETVNTKYEKQKCLGGCLPNYCLRLKLGRLIFEMIQDIKGLQEKGLFPDGLFSDSVREPPKMPTSSLSGSTAEKVRHEIWQCIMNGEEGMIGVCGMGGVGKTTIMKNLYNQLKETRDFDGVIWVTISRPLDLKKLQNKIAKELGFDLSSSADVMSSSVEIFAALSRMENFLLILDDMWDPFSLEEVGIPQPNRENRSKIVLTTRDAKVCRGMETQRVIKVEVLPEGEAWILFKDKVGADISPEIEPTAKLISGECGGLPLAIITVGRAMRQVDDVETWRNSLQELESSSTEIEGMGDRVFEILKFSYDRLRSDRLRDCFLYCVLFPEDKEIDVIDLIDYWIGEGLIDEVGDRDKERVKGHALVNELKDACMIEGGKVPREGLRMHDLFRDLAINITRKHPRFLAKAGLGLREPPRVEEWVKCVERISLMRNNIEAFQIQPDCPQLLTLLLQRNPIMQNISNSFFKNMHGLRVLDLSCTHIDSLPDSLSDLENLHALIFTKCSRLTNLPSLTKLKKLRVLNLNGTSIRELPRWLGELLNLRYLDISYTRYLCNFPSGILSKLFYLETLLMRRSGWRWSSAGRNIGDKADVGEIINTKCLTELGAEFADMETFTSYINSQKWQVLKHFDLSMGSLPLSQCDHSIQLEGCEILAEENPITLPSNTHLLKMDRCSGFGHLSELLGSSNLTQLITCIVRRCDNMEWIETDGRVVFPNLESLTLQYLPGFKGMCKGPAPEATFRNLRILDVARCDQLKCLIPIELQNSLQYLEEILVWKCKLMEEIIAGEGGATVQRLKSLTLRHLPALKRVCKGNLVCSSLSSVRVRDCWDLKKLPISVNNMPPGLKEIKGNRKWWDALEWDDHKVKGILQSFLIED